MGHFASFANRRLLLLGEHLFRAGAPIKSLISFKIHHNHMVFGGQKLKLSWRRPYWTPTELRMLVRNPSRISVKCQTVLAQFSIFFGSFDHIGLIRAVSIVSSCHKQKWHLVTKIGPYNNESNQIKIEHDEIDKIFKIVTNLMKLCMQLVSTLHSFIRFLFLFILSNMKKCNIWLIGRP